MRARARARALALGSVGIVYGEIGTSPLYALKESLHAATGGGHAPTREIVLGIVLLILWVLIPVDRAVEIGAQIRIRSGPRSWPARGTDVPNLAMTAGVRLAASDGVMAVAAHVMRLAAAVRLRLTRCSP